MRAAVCFFRVPGFPVWFHRPGSAAAGRALFTPCSRSHPGAFPRQETKPSGLCTRAALGFNFFFFLLGLLLAEYKAEEGGGGEEYRFLTSKIQPFRAPHPISSRHGGSVAEFSRPAAQWKERRFPHTGLVVGRAQEIRLLPPTG